MQVALIIGEGSVEAADGPAALSAAKERKPDLILLDIMMPGQKGTRVYQTLREDPDTRAIPVVFLTGLAQGQLPYAQQDESEGRYFVLGKPYSPDELLRTIRQALGGTGLRSGGGDQGRPGPRPD